MILTTEILARFVGGQVEIQNERERYLYRGEIKTAIVVDDEVRLTTNWTARAQGYPPIPTGWIVDHDHSDYRANLIIYGVSSIGSSGGEVGGGDRLCLFSQVVGEVVIFFPPNGSKLDPANVRGLVLPATK